MKEVEPTIEPSETYWWMKREMNKLALDNLRLAEENRKLREELDEQGRYLVDTELA